MITVVVGTGYTGLRLLGRLPAENTLGLSRSVPGQSGGREVRVLDLDDEAGGRVGNFDDYAIVYTVPPATNAQHDYRLERLLENLDTPPRRFVYLSTTGVYGNRGGKLVSENDALNPSTARAARRVAAETMLEGWARDSSAEVSILRVPGIYGPDRLMIERVRDRAPWIREAEANPGNRIHVDDLVSACIAAVDLERAAGIYNLGDGDTRSSTWFATTVAGFLGLPAPPTVTRAEAEATFSSGRLSFLGESRVIDTSRMRKVLGVTPRFADAREGIRSSLEEMALL